MYRVDAKTEKLLLKYLNPMEEITLAEIQELAEGLLNACRRYVLETNKTISFSDIIYGIFYQYIKFIEEARNIKIKERIEFVNILRNYLKEVMPVQAILSGIYESTGVIIVIKLIFLLAYYSFYYWYKRLLRKFIVKLEEEIRKNGNLKTFLEKWEYYFKKSVEEKVWYTSPEVEEFSKILYEIRSLIR